MLRVNVMTIILMASTATCIASNRTKVQKNVNHIYQKPTLNLIVQRKTLLSGFHRELVITLTVGQKNDGLNQYYVMLKEAFPRDTFIDPYQIQQLPELHKQVVLLPHTIDLEKTAQDSDPQTIYVFFSASDCILSNTSCSITVPYHFRYQKANDTAQNGNYVDVYLHNPTVLVRQKDADVVFDWDGDVIKELCSPLDRRECLWSKFPEINSSPPLHFQVPCGDLKHLGTVTVITTLVIFIGFVYLVYAIYERPQKTTPKYKYS